METVGPEGSKTGRTPLTHPESVLLAYSDQISVAPGDIIRFMVSCTDTEYSNEIVRLIHGDDSKNGLGYKHEVVATELNRNYKGRLQTTRIGSCVMVPDSPTLCVKEGLSVTAWIFTTTPGKGIQGLLTKWCSVEGGSYGLFIDESGGLAFCITESGREPTWTRTGKPLQSSTWYFVAATYDSHKGHIALYQKRCGPWAHNGGFAIASKTANVAEGLGFDSGVPLYIGAFVDSPTTKAIIRGHFNGKIDGPALFNRALDQKEIEMLERDEVIGRFGNTVVAAW